MTAAARRPRRGGGAAPPALDRLPTEAAHPRAAALDRMSTAALVDLLCREELRTARAVRAVRGSIAAGADRIARALAAGGRLIYVGAGTSGRLGVLDASECPPTFGVAPDRVLGVIAGGARALTRAVEGAEDRGDSARRRVARLGVGAADVVCAIAASGVTPFARAALAAARARGATTIFVTCAPAAELAALADVVIGPRVGPEALTGSTRLKAGTATKLVLNALSTAAMVRLGKVYGRHMIDLEAGNAKLRARARRIVGELLGLDDRRAASLLARAGGRPKVAVVMGARRVPRRRAEALLERAGGRLREVVGDLP